MVLREHDSQSRSEIFVGSEVIVEAQLRAISSANHREACHRSSKRRSRIVPTEQEEEQEVGVACHRSKVQVEKKEVGEGSGSKSLPLSGNARVIDSKFLSAIP